MSKNNDQAKTSLGKIWTIQCFITDDSSLDNKYNKAL